MIKLVLFVKKTKSLYIEPNTVTNLREASMSVIRFWDNLGNISQPLYRIEV